MHIILWLLGSKPVCATSVIERTGDQSVELNHGGASTALQCDVGSDCKDMDHGRHRDGVL